MGVRMRGAILFLLLFMLCAATASAGFVGLARLGVASGAVEDPSDVDFPSDTIATLENSIVVQTYEQRIGQNETYDSRFLYPAPEAEFKMGASIILVRWDEIGNALLSLNWSTVRLTDDRKFFLTINDDVRVVDPVNNSDCAEDVDGYTCLYVFNTTERLVVGYTLREVEVTTNARSHSRYINLATIVPRTIPTQFDTLVGIGEYYYQKSRFVIAIWEKILTVFYYLVMVGAFAGALYVFIVGLVWLHDLIAGKRGVRRG